MRRWVGRWIIGLGTRTWVGRRKTYRIAEQGLGLADCFPIDDHDRQLVERVRSTFLGLGKLGAADAHVVKRNIAHFFGGAWLFGCVGVGVVWVVVDG